jgi:hypothetical protein
VTAFGLLKRIREPDVSKARAEAEREAWIRGEPAPPVEERFDRYIRDESGDGRAAEVRFGQEACRVLEELQRRGGRALVSELRGGIKGALRPFVRDGVADLQRLGVVRERPGVRPGDAVVEVVAGHERTRLTSGWSRATW